MVDLVAEHLHLAGVIQDVSVRVPAGSCLGVVGINGAGKSTLLGLLAGVLKPDRGTVRGAADVAYLPEGCPLDGSIPVHAWLTMATHLPGWEPGVGAELADSLELPLNHRAGRLSQGQRVRLGLVLTLGRRAGLYVLDDPWLGLDPVGRARVQRAIAQRAREATVVIAGQDGEAIEALASHLLVLRGGRVVWNSTFPALRAAHAGPLHELLDTLR